MIVTLGIRSIRPGMAFYNSLLSFNLSGHYIGAIKPMRGLCDQCI